MIKSELRDKVRIERY